ncbi:MAG: DUF5989 family protein [Bdellovibrionales bacterium]
MSDFIKEIADFLIARRKYWLAPAFATGLLLGGLLVLAKGSAVAPLIYAIF